MADKAWTDRKEYKRLHSELRALSRDAFADRALALLRIRWPACIAAPRLRTIDRAGVDLFDVDLELLSVLAVDMRNRRTGLIGQIPFA